MPISSQSKARLRTRTGCLECRQGRKKCDEHRPQCPRCTSRGLPCTWPTASTQPLDGRRREAQNQSRAREPTISAKDNQSLMTHFVEVVVPQLVRQECSPLASDQSHLLRRANQYPPLMAILIAIAAVDLGKDAVAMERYLFSLRDLRNRMALAPDAGNEDGLLATTICLCLFENRRPDAPPSIGVHITAARALLLRRDSMRSAKEASHSVLAFERTCLESFLYHSTLMMLFDPSLDVITDDLPNWLAYESADYKDVALQPILDGPYHFFILIADVTRMARLSRPLYASEYQKWARLQASVLHTQLAVSADDPVRGLYLRALQVLLLKADNLQPYKRRIAAIRAYSREAFNLMGDLDVKKYLVSYFLWPVAVFGAIAIAEDEQRTIEDTISPWARIRCGQAVRLQQRLRHIWTLPMGNEEETLKRRLEVLLDVS